MVPDVAAAREISRGRGSDLVLEATNAPTGLADACEAARIGGRLVVVGIPDGNVYTGLAADGMRRKGLTVRMSRRMGNVMHRGIELVAQGKVEVESCVTHHFPLEEAAKAFALQSQYEDRVLKSALDVGVR